MSDDLLEQYGRAFEAYRSALRCTDVVTQPGPARPSSMPILYFGDLDAYLASSLRVVTAGLNPSQVEFPIRPTSQEPTLTDDPWQRFPAARGLQASAPGYEKALKEYFKVKPYWPWFRNFTSMLAALESSFVTGAAANVALHTDICTPVPTTPTWSGLCQSEKRVLSQDGHSLWRDLVGALRPDVILMSVKASDVAAVGLGNPNQWACEMAILDTQSGAARARPYSVRMSRQQVARGAETLLVWGQAAEVPFGTISMLERARIGERAMSKLTMADAPSGLR